MTKIGKSQSTSALSAQAEKEDVNTLMRIVKLNEDSLRRGGLTLDDLHKQREQVEHVLTDLGQIDSSLPGIEHRIGKLKSFWGLGIGQGIKELFSRRKPPTLERDLEAEKERWRREAAAVDAPGPDPTHLSVPAQGNIKEHLISVFKLQLNEIERMSREISGELDQQDEMLEVTSKAMDQVQAGLDHANNHLDQANCVVHW